MASPTLVASVLTLVPAMGLIYYVLRRYEGYFEQNRLFFALALGLFAGTAVRFLEVRFFPFDNPRSLQPGTEPLALGTLVYSVTYTTLFRSGLLWFVLRRYEGYFEQNRLFFALALGLFAGTAVRFLEVRF